MCGICGIIDFSGNTVKRESIQTMLGAITHRGPDDEGIYVEDSIGMGIRRLSIVDLKTGAQPIGNEDRTCWIVFNGEIYNYIELKREHSIQTTTDSDTEVLLRMAS